VSAPAPRQDESRTCVTCGDVADEVAVVDLDPVLALARCVTDAGEELDVDAGLFPDAAPGDRLLVHAGAAIAKLGPERPAP
jgi:hypothetical protein